MKNITTIFKKKSNSKEIQLLNRTENNITLANDNTFILTSKFKQPDTKKNQDFITDVKQKKKNFNFNKSVDNAVNKKKKMISFNQENSQDF